MKVNVHKTLIISAILALCGQALAMAPGMSRRAGNFGGAGHQIGQHRMMNTGNRNQQYMGGAAIGQQRMRGMGQQGTMAGHGAGRAGNMVAPF